MFACLRRVSVCNGKTTGVSFSSFSFSAQMITATTLFFFSIKPNSRFNTNSRKRAMYINILCLVAVMHVPEKQWYKPVW